MCDSDLIVDTWYLLSYNSLLYYAVPCVNKAYLILSYLYYIGQINPKIFNINQQLDILNQNRYITWIYKVLITTEQITTKPCIYLLYGTLWFRSIQHLRCLKQNNSSIKPPQSYCCVSNFHKCVCMDSRFLYRIKNQYKSLVAADHRTA